MKPAIFVILLCGLPSVEARAATNVIAPAAAAGVEGNSSLAPFSQGFFRIQQVYSSSLFASFPQGINIGAIAFRSDRSAGSPGSVALHDIEIHLSTTTMPVDGLSTMFDLNVGRDDRLVRSRSPFGMNFTGGGSIGPSAWILERPAVDILDEPFYYNPGAGNLLLDIRVQAVLIGPMLLDAVNTSGDSVSSVYAPGPLALPDTGTASTLGLATWFSFQPIPEPGTMSLFALGVVTAGLLGRKGLLRKRKH